MGGLFQQLHVPRSQVAADNPVLYDDGRAVLEFYTPSHEYHGKQVVPVGNKWSDGTRSVGDTPRGRETYLTRNQFMAPIAHYHLLQTESFYVESGRGLWYLKGKTIELKAGDIIQVPRCHWHTFENHPDSEEPLSILYRYDSQRFVMEEKFFRNTLTYMWDCKRANVDPCPFQLCLFLSNCWMPGGLVPFPGDYASCAVNAIMMWVFAFIAKYLYGYKSSYPEYWDEEVFKKRIAPESKKSA